MFLKKYRYPDTVHTFIDRAYTVKTMSMQRLFGVGATTLYVPYYVPSYVLTYMA